MDEVFGSLYHNPSLWSIKGDLKGTVLKNGDGPVFSYLDSCYLLPQAQAPQE